MYYNIKEPIPLVKKYLPLYIGIQHCWECEGKQLIVVWRDKNYKDHTFSLGDNGGEINITKPNVPNFGGSCDTISVPTTSWDYSVNIETIIYRILCVFKDEPIDYDYRDSDYVAATLDPSLYKG